MHYFITSQIDDYTSAIELAEIKRLHLFDDLNQPAVILTRNYVRNARQTWARLGISGQVINLFQYFLGTNVNRPVVDTNAAINRLSNLPIHHQVALVNGKVRLKVVRANSEIYYVDYFDQWGFTDRRDFYEANYLAYSEYFDDAGKLNTRVYYDQAARATMIFRYHGGPNNQPILSLIMLTHGGRHLQFDDLDHLMAYFLDCLAKADTDPRFYCDREDIAVLPFGLMNQPAKRYIVLHSTFTQNAQRNGDFYPYVKQIAKMTNRLAGIISSTAAETADVSARIPGVKAYTVPVSYLPATAFMNQPAFANRKRGQLIAVARVTKMKQLDHIIHITLRLHQTLPFVDLKIYGYEDSTSDPQTVQQLHRLITDNQAAAYIHFCGYVKDLTPAYEQADITVLTSQFEGFSMAVLEALGHGCPVVSYDVNYGPGEMIKTGINGALIQPNDQEAMYTAIKQLLVDQTRLAVYSRQATEPLQRFSAAAVRKDWLEVIEDQHGATSS
jgi:poly(glycerol-phosphate) alpha-glucosyltransferase